jgi:type 2 lantibiotic biosynthesis protein LanM
MPQEATTRTSRLTEHLYSALSLAERAACLRQAGEEIRSRADTNRGTAALKRWKLQQPFPDGVSFQRRLHLDGLTEQDLLVILGLPAESYAKLMASPPDWALALEQIYLDSPPTDADSEFLQYIQEETNAFLWIAYPLIHEGLRQFRERIAQCSREDLPFDPTTVERMVLRHLFNTLKATLELVMVLELNVARLDGVLGGETPEERFRCFCERIQQTDVQLSIAREYPAMFRSLYTATVNWVNSTSELIERLSEDWTLIRSRLADGADPGKLTSLTAGAGDAHRGGRTVAILEFSSGFKLVYKPHSQSVDVHFGELLDWMNQAGFETPFRALKVIDRGSYGWSEFVAHQPCSSRQQVERFYHRLGGYLAIFYITKASDMHFENLLAVSEFPMPVDIETLFHVPVSTEKDDPAIHAFQLSVMRALLLPQRIYASATTDGVDMSGFGAKDGQNFPAGRASSWDKAGTDEMRLLRGKMLPMDVMGNRPKLDGEDVVASEYLDIFVKGFQWVYRLVEKHRDELLAPGGMLERFGEDDVRFIPRSTHIYGALLRTCQHPDLFRNAIDRDRIFDHLWLNAVEQEHLERLIPSELKDLQNGDIPVFASRPASRDLWSSEGHRIPDVFEQSAMTVVRDGLNRMGDEDLARQVSFICTSIASAGEGDISDYAPAPRKVFLSSQRGPLDQARAVGDILCRDALQNEFCASWIGISFVGVRERSISLQPLDLGLYNGLAGCSMFLAYLAETTGDPSYEAVARKTLTLVRRYLDRGRKSGMPIPSLGGFSGLGGMIYTLTHLAILFDDASLLDEANLLASDVPALVAADHTLDVIGGAAGAIAALEVLNKIKPRRELLDAALLCGERLLARQQPQDQGAAWKTDIDCVRPLTGFSHGAAGMAWALLKLAAWSEQGRFREAAVSAIAYERSTFVAEEANWPDYRARVVEDPSSKKFMNAWCHGAPGIALGRIDSLQYMDDRDSRDEIRIGLRKMVESGFGESHCLCHGDLGTLDILLHAARRVDESWWSECGKPLASQAMATIVERGCLCGTQTSLATPGLMIGLAGIGYGLLRLACPERIPSVLVLEPPIQM